MTVFGRKKKKKTLKSTYDVVSYILLKRKLRQQFKRLLNVSIFLVVFFVIIILTIKRQKIVDFTSNIKHRIYLSMEKLTTYDLKKVSINLKEDTMLNEQEVATVVDKITNEKITKSNLEYIITVLEKNNSLIDKVSIRKSLATNELIIDIKEKKIIAVLLSDECKYSQEQCKKRLITIDNKQIPFHKLPDKNEEFILRIYGKIGDSDINHIFNVLNDKRLFKKVRYIHFFTSGRFNLELKNGLLVYLPRKKWENAISRFINIDSEYGLSSAIDGRIKYIDIRLKDKIFISEK